MKKNDLRIMVAILFLFICPFVHAQSKIHFHVDYHYLMGVVLKHILILMPVMLLEVKYPIKEQ